MRLPVRKELSSYWKPIAHSSFRYYVINSFSALLIKIHRILMTQVATKNDEVEVKSSIKLYLTSF